MCLWLVACARAPVGPFFDDARYLRFGIDPRAEANAVVAQHKELGELLVRRIEGESFTALGFDDAHGHGSGVRVVTKRGIVVELDRELPSAVSKGTAYVLLPAPRDSSQDADADGFDEVFIERRRGEQACVLVYRVRDEGSADPVPAQAEVFDQSVCPSELRDVDGDGLPELIAELSLWEGPGAPRVRVPLFAHNHAFSVDGKPAALARFCAQEQTARRADLDQARRTLDVSTAYRLAVELAALRKLAGEPAAEQVRTFDDALRGLVLDAGQSSTVAATREHIYGPWNAPHPRPRAPELVSTPAS